MFERADEELKKKKKNLIQEISVEFGLKYANLHFKIKNGSKVSQLVTLTI